MFRRIKLYFYRRKREKQRERIAKKAREAGIRAAESMKDVGTATAAFAEGLRSARINEGSVNDEA